MLLCCLMALASEWGHAVHATCSRCEGPHDQPAPNLGTVRHFEFQTHRLAPRFPLAERPTPSSIALDERTVWRIAGATGHFHLLSYSQA